MTLRKVTALWVHDGVAFRSVGPAAGPPGPGPLAPSVPTGLAGTPADTSVALSWSASTPPDGGSVDYYEVADADTSAVLGRPEDTSLTVTGLTAGTTYRFMVRAVAVSGVASEFTTPVVVTTTNTGGWSLVWEDTFNAAGVNTSFWNIRNNSTQSNMDGRNMSYNVVCDGAGTLKIFGKKETVGSQQWTCGYIDTIGKRSWKPPFRAEARLRVSWGAGGKGMWPAFWLRPDDGGDGEIDVMEAWPSRSQISFTVWQNYSGGGHPSFNLPTSQVDGAWHTYAVEAEPTALRFYFDGQLRWSPSLSTYSWLGPILSRSTGWNIRHNLQIGGSWGGTPDAGTDFSVPYETDYIRIWTR